MIDNRDQTDISLELFSCFKKLSSLKSIINVEANKIIVELKKCKKGILIFKALSDVFKNEKVTEADYKLFKEKVNGIDSNIDNKINFRYSNEDGIVYRIVVNNDETKYLNPNSVVEVVNELTSRDNLLNTILLTSLVSIFEGYLSFVYKRIIKCDSCKYFENKQVLISKIINGNLNDIIEDEISQLIVKEMTDPFKVINNIENKEGFKLLNDSDVLNNMSDINLARNVFAHNNGIVDDVYIKKVKNRNGINNGQKLSISFNNMISMINNTYKVLFLIYYNTVNNLYELDVKWYTNLHKEVFELLMKKEYIVTEYIYKIMSSNHNSKIEYKDRAICRINYMISLKEQKKVDLLRKELNNFDISGSDEQLKIAKECLEGKNENVYKYLNKGFPRVFTADVIMKWPLFIEFRASEYYKKFLSEHKDDFDIQKYDDSKKLNEDK